MSYAIGIDIGGTKTAVGIVDQTGSIIDYSKLPTDVSISPEYMMDRIYQEAEWMINKTGRPVNEFIGIGIGAPGPLDSMNGMIICPPNLKTWEGFHIVEYLEQKCSMPIVLENDANAAGLAEKWLGAGKGHDNFIYMTISTGIGSGIIADGKLLRGSKGNAGDVGHTVVDPGFGQCICGQYGCLESIASGTAISKLGSKILGRRVSAKEVFELYALEHQDISPWIERIFRALGASCVSLINTFDTEKIVLGGGVSDVGEPLFQAIREYVSKYALNPKGRETEIVPAELKQHAGVIGAAALWFNMD